MGRKRIPRLSVEPLLEHLGVKNVSTAARLLGEYDPRNFYRYVKSGGFPVHYADKLAVRMGRLPQDIWGAEYDAVDFKRVDTETVRYLETSSMSEAQLLGAVGQIALLNKWLIYHTHDSRRSAPGFPDLVLVRGPRVVFAELKTARGKMTEDQKEWRDKLCAADAEWYLWRPHDLETVVMLLGRDMATRAEWIAYTTRPMDAA